MEVAAATTDGDDKSYEVGNPGLSLPEVDEVEAEEGDAEGDEAGDDDAYVDAHVGGVEGCEGLPAGDGGHEGEAGHGGGVEEEGDDY